jgi:hypothetical protein
MSADTEHGLTASDTKGWVNIVLLSGFGIQNASIRILNIIRIWISQ